MVPNDDDDDDVRNSKLSGCAKFDFLDSVKLQHAYKGPWVTRAR